MAEETMDWKPLIDRMKAEGQLTRNTGTNSIKSVNVNLEKLTGVFQTISQSLVMQSSFLESAYNIQTAQYELDRERARDAERLARLSQPDPEPEAPEPETNDDDDEKPKPEKSGSFLKELFSSGTFKKAAIVGVAGPFIYGFLKGSIDELTGGKFSEFEKIVFDKLPDLWKNIKTVVSSIYGSISKFLETGDINDLIPEDEEGNKILDIEQLKKRATQFSAVALSGLMFGPLGAIAAGVGIAIQEAFEKLTGIDLYEYLGPAGQAFFTAGAGLVLSTTARGLIMTAFRGLFLTPYGLIALAVGAAIAGLFSLLKGGRERVQGMNDDMTELANDYKQAIEDGDTELAEQLERRMAADAQRLTDRVGGLGPQSEEGRDQSLAALQQVGGINLERQLEEGFDPNADNDAANERMRALAQYANILERSNVSERDKLEAMRQIVELLPDNRRRDLNDATLSEIEGYVKAGDILQQLGVDTPRNDDTMERTLGNLLNQYLIAQGVQADGISFTRTQIEPREIVGDDWYERGTFSNSIWARNARKAQEEWDATYGQFYNPDGTLKVDMLSNLTDELKQIATGQGFAVNTGGNTFVGGSSSSSAQTTYNFNGGGVPSQALSNLPHQQ